MSPPRDEISRRLATLDALNRLLPPGGLCQVDRVEEEMEVMISRDYEPYFCGNAALHLCFSCRRCGRCCKDSEDVAVSMEDCRKLARHLSLSAKKFILLYTRPHTLKGRDVGTARLIKKSPDGSCPFHDPAIPGCAVHQVKPQVCTAAFYLSKMNLLMCRENGSFSAFPHCPGDIELRAGMEEFWTGIDDHPPSRELLHQAFRSPSPQVRLFLLLLRLKGMEIYFGREKALPLARRLGLKRMPEDHELRPAAFLYAASLLEVNREKEASRRQNSFENTAI
ncbi:MAG: hypothetical protein GKC10_01625 [Methanosarcinales archaeon]|nr:hypothetical protein [Methanosarcinales archaeon]